MAPHDIPPGGAGAPHGYLFDTGSDLGLAQVTYLEALLDAATVDMLDDIVRPGARCLEIGAGGGSIARWMAGRAGADGRVVAVDLDTSHLQNIDGLTVRRHDINDGLPDAGPYDLIHARLVLLHLPHRLEILRTLVDALAPGGWLVVGDYSGDRLPHTVRAPSPEDAAVFDRVMEVSHRVAGARAGQSLEWAREAADRLEASGLVDVHVREHTRTITGGDVGSRYLHNLITQILAPLESAGLTRAELSRSLELLLDPRFRAWFYQFVITRGRRPLPSPADGV